MQKSERAFVDFSGCDYLGLAKHPQVIEAFAEAAKEFGVSATGGRWSVGWSELHERLESEIARFMGTEDACFVSNGYLCGAVCFETMSGERPTVFHDAQIHASQLMGIRAAGLPAKSYAHTDASNLERLLAEHRGPAIIATDGLFGMSGAIAPLREIAALAVKHGAHLVVDDSHGVGVLGRNGRGALEHCGVNPESTIVMCSLSKAFGCSGGFLTGAKVLVELFRRAAPSCGSTPLPAALAAASLKALELIVAHPESRIRLEATASAMRKMIADSGIEVLCPTSPILTMCLDDAGQAQRLSQAFAARGLRIPYFSYPGEKRDNLLRTIARSTHTTDDLERFRAALRY